MKKEMLEKLKTLSVLCVEDEVGIRENIVKSLKYFVKEVYEAENGQIGFELYKKHKPDIILTDIMMPIMDGLELVRKVRKEDKEVCVVIVTAYTDQEYLLQAVDMHLEQYIVKPVNLDSLSTALNRCFERIKDKHTFVRKLPEGYEYDMDHKLLTYNGELIKLNKKEIAFIELLLVNLHRVVTYEELQEYVWQDDVMTDSALRSLVRNIRKKIPSELITNLSGVGYRLNVD